LPNKEKVDYMSKNLDAQFDLQKKWKINKRENQVIDKLNVYS
jgi:hypothetical protein